MLNKFANKLAQDKQVEFPNEKIDIPDNQAEFASRVVDVTTENLKHICQQTGPKMNKWNFPMRKLRHLTVKHDYPTEKLDPSESQTVITLKLPQTTLKALKNRKIIS